MASAYNSPDGFAGRSLNDGWLDERRQELLMLKEINGQLLRQKLNKVVALFNERASLSICPDGHVRMGAVFKLVHLGLGLQSQTCLAANISSMELLGSECDPSLILGKSTLPVTAMKDGFPVMRNTFTITDRIDGRAKCDRPLCYGDTFSLCAQISNEKRFLHSMNHIGRVTSGSLHQELTLTPHVSNYAQWRVLPTNTDNQLELEGKPISVDVPVVFNHVFTNQNLCLEPHPRRTLFGMESEVSVHSYSNGRRTLNASNVWSFAGYAIN